MLIVIQHKSTLWMECLKLVNVLKSTFLGSDFHTECFVIKMKKNKNKIPPPVPIFYQTATGSTGIFFRPKTWAIGQPVGC